VMKSGATGELLKQAIAINQSLSTLGTVVNMLTSRRNTGNVPYRSSKLTYLLEEALGGNCYTYVLSNVSPAARSYSATHGTLQFAARARLVVTRPTAAAVQEAPSPRKGRAKPSTALVVRAKTEEDDPHNPLTQWLPRFMRSDVVVHQLNGFERRELVVANSELLMDPRNKTLKESISHPTRIGYREPVIPQSLKKKSLAGSRESLEWSIHGSLRKMLGGLDRPSSAPAEVQL